jgi:hypothetical protein
MLQPEFVIFTVRWFAGGGGRRQRGPGAGVATRPAQPVTGVRHGDGDEDDEDGEQTLDVVAGQGDESQRWWGAGVLGDRGYHREGVGQHGQGHPRVPGVPTADLVPVQAAQPLAGLEGLLHLLGP